jgi:enamine deaminase RidA (YjgF/YER057c/UK114 family)
VARIRRTRRRNRCAARPEEQAGFTFENIQNTFLTLGSSLDHVIKITTLLRDPRDEASYQKAFAKYLPHQPPATPIMGVQLAYPEMIVEIEAIAVIPVASPQAAIPARRRPCPSGPRSDDSLVV